MAQRTATGTHLFVSPAGDVLERWRQAFPSARGAGFNEAVDAVAAGDVGVLWLRLRDDSLEVARLLAMALPVPALVLSDRPQDEEALEVFSGGARGYCNTHAMPLLLRRAGAVVATGGLWIGEPLMLRLVRAMTAAAPAVQWPDGLAPLSAAEREVLEPLARGGACHEVAARAGLTEQAVRDRLKAILAKADVSDRFELTLRIAPSRVGNKLTLGPFQGSGGLRPLVT